MPVAWRVAVLIGVDLGSEADIITYMVNRYFGPELYQGRQCGIHPLRNRRISSSATHMTFSVYRGPGSSYSSSCRGTSPVLRLGEYPFREHRKSGRVGQHDLPLEKAPALSQV